MLMIFTTAVNVKNKYAASKIVIMLMGWLYIFNKSLLDMSLKTSLLFNKGLLNLMPSMALWWFLLSSCNMAAPPSLNLLGEIGLFNSMVGWMWMVMLFLMLISFFSAAYTLYLYSYSQHGIYYSGIYSSVSGYCREYLLLMLHWLPLNLLILKSDFVLIWF